MLPERTSLEERAEIRTTEDKPMTPSRRRFVQMTAGGLGAAAFARSAGAQQPTGIPPSTVTSPAREWGRHAPPAIYPDPDVIIVDPVFAQYRVGNAGLHRVATGFQWAEGPAWS